MPAPVIATDTTFRTEVIESDRPVLVFFWAEWNSTCKGLAPSIAVLAEEDAATLKVAKLDVDANPVTPSMFGVTMVPTLMLFREGRALFRIVGYRRIEVLRAEIEAALVGV
jgi:thioredoxin 1